MVRLLWIRVRRGGDCQHALYEQLSAFIPLIRKDKSRVSNFILQSTKNNSRKE